VPESAIMITGPDPASRVYMTRTIRAPTVNLPGLNSARRAADLHGSTDAVLGLRAWTQPGHARWSRRPQPGQRPVAASNCSMTMAGMRPRSLI